MTWSLIIPQLDFTNCSRPFKHSINQKVQNFWWIIVGFTGLRKDNFVQTRRIEVNSGFVGFSALGKESFVQTGQMDGGDWSKPTNIVHYSLLYQLWFVKRNILFRCVWTLESRLWTDGEIWENLVEWVKSSEGEETDGKCNAHPG